MQIVYVTLNTINGVVVGGGKTEIITETTGLLGFQADNTIK